MRTGTGRESCIVEIIIEWSENCARALSEVPKTLVKYNTQKRSKSDPDSWIEVKVVSASGGPVREFPPEKNRNRNVVIDPRGFDTELRERDAPYLRRRTCA